MPGPPKITLAQAQAQGGFALTFYCQNLAAHCSHSGEIRLNEAITRWGGSLRLDQVPARCTKCGERRFVDVRYRPPLHAGVGSTGPKIE